MVRSRLECEGRQVLWSFWYCHLVWKQIFLPHSAMVVASHPPSLRSSWTLYNTTAIASPSTIATKLTDTLQHHGRHITIHHRCNSWTLYNVVAIMLLSTIVESSQMWIALQHCGCCIVICPFVCLMSINVHLSRFHPSSSISSIDVHPQMSVHQHTSIMIHPHQHTIFFKPYVHFFKIVYRFFIFNTYIYILSY